MQTGRTQDSHRLRLSDKTLKHIIKEHAINNFIDFIDHFLHKYKCFENRVLTIFCHYYNHVYNQT